MWFGEFLSIAETKVYTLRKEEVMFIDISLYLRNMVSHVRHTAQEHGVMVIHKRVYV